MSSRAPWGKTAIGEQHERTTCYRNRVNSDFSLGPEGSRLSFARNEAGIVPEYTVMLVDEKPSVAITGIQCYRKVNGEASLSLFDVSIGYDDGRNRRLPWIRGSSRGS